MARRFEADEVAKVVSAKNRTIKALEAQLNQKRACYYVASLSEMSKLNELYLQLKRGGHIGEIGKATEKYLAELVSILDRLFVKVRRVPDLKEYSRMAFEDLCDNAHEWHDVLTKLMSDAAYAERMVEHHKVMRSMSSFQDQYKQLYGRGKVRYNGTYGIGCTKLG